MKRPLTKRQLQDIRGLFIVSENLASRLNDTLALRTSNYKRDIGRIEFWCSKTGKIVSIPVLPEVKDYIESLPPSQDPDPPLFETLYRAPRQGARNVYTLIRRVMIASGVRTKVRPVTHRFLRRRAALIVGQEDPLAAQHLLDHEHLQTTEIYMRAKQKKSDEGVAIIKKHAVLGRVAKPDGASHNYPRELTKSAPAIAPETPANIPS